MNASVAKAGSAITAAAVAAFALCVVTSFHFGRYMAGMFIVFGFVMMMAGFHAESGKDHQTNMET